MTPINGGMDDKIVLANRVKMKYNSFLETVNEAKGLGLEVTLIGLTPQPVPIPSAAYLSIKAPL